MMRARIMMMRAIIMMTSKCKNLSRVQENLAALAVWGQVHLHWEAENTWEDNIPGSTPSFSKEKWPISH